MKPDFKKQIYKDAKRLFPKGTVETLVAPPKIFEPIDPAVRLVHKSSGVSAVCDEFESQTENFIAAAIRLRIACDKKTR
jgi:hypothetical protein